MGAIYRGGVGRWRTRNILHWPHCGYGTKYIHISLIIRCSNAATRYIYRIHANMSDASIIEQSDSLTAIILWLGFTRVLLDILWIIQHACLFLVIYGFPNREILVWLSSIHGRGRENFFFFLQAVQIVMNVFFFKKLQKYVINCIACLLKNTHDQIQYMHGVKKTNQIVKVTIYTFHNLIFFSI